MRIEKWTFPDGTPFSFDLKLRKKNNYGHTAPKNQKNKLDNEAIIEYFEFKKKEQIEWIPIIQQTKKELSQMRKISLYKYQLMNAINTSSDDINTCNINELIGYAVNNGIWRTEMEKIIFIELENNRQTDHTNDMNMEQQNNN